MNLDWSYVIVAEAITFGILVILNLMCFYYNNLKLVHASPSTVIERIRRTSTDIDL